MERIEYLDRAKAIGMFLVYYGHFTEQLVKNHYNSSLLQMKFIYSFHMPLFFFIAGVFWKPDLDITNIFRKKIQTRIIPVLFWGIALLPFWSVTIPQSEILSKMGMYAYGFPGLNGVTWFLVCLFSLEMLASIINARLALDWPKAIGIAAVSFLLGFFMITPYGFNWYIGEALVVMNFYLTGYLLKKFLITDFNPKLQWLVVVILGCILCLTFDLNVGPFSAQFPVPMIALLSHGNPWYFLLTAFVGIFATLAFSRALKVGREPFKFVSENLLIFLGLNGICFHFLNQYLISSVFTIPDTGLAVSLFTSIYVVVVMSLFSPIVMGLRRWIPELVGYPWDSRSLLPPIDSWFTKRVQRGVETD